MDIQDFENEPPAPAEELVRPPRVADIIRLDSVDADPVLLESTETTLGTAPIDARRYYAREFFDLENEKLWPRVWQYACWSYDIEKPGDIAVYRNAGRSVLIVRQRDGSIKAYANSCLHRGRELCTADLQHQEELRCPYHGFTWRLDGALKWYPSKWDFPNVNPETHTLPEIRCEVWNGFVFINFDADAPSLRKYLGKIVDQFEQTPAWDYNKRFMAVNVVKKVRTNWKACMDAFIEAFHAYFTHPQTGYMGDAAGSQYDVWPDEPHFSRMHTVMGYASSHYPETPANAEIIKQYLENFGPELLDHPEAKTLPGESSREAVARLTRLLMSMRSGMDMSSVPATYALDTIQYFVFPNFFPWPSLGAPIVYRFRPGATPDECIYETALFLPFSGERPASGPTIHLGFDDSLADVPELGGLGPVLQQDIENLDAMQNGLRASIAQKLTLTEYQEVRIRHYHKTLDTYLYD